MGELEEGFDGRGEGRGGEGDDVMKRTDGLCIAIWRWTGLGATTCIFRLDFFSHDTTMIDDSPLLEMMEGRVQLETNEHHLQPLVYEVLYGWALTCSPDNPRKGPGALRKTDTISWLVRRVY
jgi:hypothetical protein